MILSNSRVSYQQIKNPTRSDFPALMMPCQGSRIGTNQAFGRKALDEQKDAVLVYVNKDSYRIALKLASKTENGSFPLIFPGPNRSNKASSISFMGWSVIQQIGWISNIRLQVPLTWNQAEELWEGLLPRENTTFVPLRREGRPNMPPRKRKSGSIVKP